MKPFQHIGLLALTMTLTFAGEACNICGCSITSGAFNGIMPQFSKNIAGLRFSSQTYTHPNTDLNMNGNSRVLVDRYKLADFWFRYYPSKRVQTFFYLPYKINERLETERSTLVGGVGDISLSAYYTIVNTGDSLDRDIKVTWLTGGGVKLPTGKYQQRDDTKTILPVGIQVGTGAYSLLLSQNLSARRNALGINSQINYTINGKNELDYKLGNSFSGTLSFFYWKNFRNAKLLPNIGLTVEHFAKDKQYNLLLENSGSKNYVANIGLDVYMKQWIISVIYQKAFYQELSNSQPLGKYRLLMSIGHLF